jgi:hypothetical protein
MKREKKGEKGNDVNDEHYNYLLMRRIVGDLELNLGVAII